MGVIFHKGKKYGGTGVKVQSDPAATSLNALEVPNGQTMTSYLNSNLDKRLITTAVGYNSTKGVWELGSGVPVPSGGKAICLVARNAQTGALYVLMWSSTANGFSIVHTLAGNAPANGNGAWIQYIA